MNTTIFGRLVWKEYRVPRNSWIAMAFGAVLLQLLILWFAERTAEVATALFLIAWAVPAFYALGCAATMFATEHETGTYAFQRALPVTSLGVFFSKITLTVISTLLLVVVLAASAYGLVRLKVPEPEPNWWLSVVWGLGTLWMMAWGVFFSLQMNAPLKAVIYAAIAWLLSIFCVEYFVYDVLVLNTVDAYFIAVLCAFGAIGAVDCVLGYRWFHEKHLARAVAERLVPGTAIPRDATGGAVMHGRRPRRASMFGRLVWQQWRQSARMIGILTVTLVILAVLGSMTEWRSVTRHSVLRGLSVVSLAVLALLMAPKIGACVFFADQHQRSFRFLAQHGVSARAVWLSRHAIWIPMTMFWSVVAAAVLALVDSRSLENLPGLVAVGFVFIVIAYTSGQLASMFMRSGPVAVIVAAILTFAFSRFCTSSWAG